MWATALLCLLLGLTLGDKLTEDDQSFLDSLNAGSCDVDSVCVPYYLCEEGDIITDGAGLIDIRFGSNKDGAGPGLNQHSECGEQFINVCCRDPLQEKPVDPVPVDPVDPVGPLGKVDTYQPVCGRRNSFGVNARISGIDDTDTQFGEFPWMAAILQIDANGTLNFVCGATLITQQAVLTAAHCVVDDNGLLSSLVVRLGEWDTQNTVEFYPHVDIDVQSVVVNENYNHARKNLHNDIALLKLAQPAQLQEHIDTLCLPDPTLSPPPGAECVATGWGKDSFDGGSYQRILKQVTLPLVYRDDCEAALRTTRLSSRFRLDDSFICAGGNGADTCTGDGGSPLACPDPTDPQRYVLSGIVSWGIGCATVDVPGVYADVNYFNFWIQDALATLFQ